MAFIYKTTKFENVVEGALSKDYEFSGKKDGVSFSLGYPVIEPAGGGVVIVSRQLVRHMDHGSSSGTNSPKFGAYSRLLSDVLLVDAGPRGDPVSEDDDRYETIPSNKDELSDELMTQLVNDRDILNEESLDLIDGRIVLRLDKGGKIQLNIKNDVLDGLPRQHQLKTAEDHYFNGQKERMKGVLEASIQAAIDYLSDLETDE
jgi:hypothetical protein